MRNFVKGTKGKTYYIHKEDLDKFNNQTNKKMRDLFEGLNITPNDEVQARVQQKINDTEQAYYDEDLNFGLRNGLIEYDGSEIIVQGKDHNYIWYATPHEIMAGFVDTYEEQYFSPGSGYSSVTRIIKAENMSEDVLKEYIGDTDLIGFCQTNKYNEREII